MSLRLPHLKPSAALLAATLSVAGMANANEPLEVVATFSILGDMVARVGGEHIALTTLVGPDGDAHVYQPTPRDAAAVAGAKVMFINGLEFEGWLERLAEAAPFDGEMVVATDGIDAIAFEDDHDDHDDHDEKGHDDHDDHGHDEKGHDDHDDHGDDEKGHDDHDEHGHDDKGHDDHDDHGHGAHAFEWAGLFELSPGTYTWSFAKVDGDYADPAMKLVMLSGEDIEAVEEAAEELLESDASESKADGDVITAANVAYSLNFDSAKDVTLFSVDVAEGGTYAFFTEHMPFEFEADAHFFKDASGADVEPTAQEPDSDHAHGHGDHDDHGGHDDHHGHNHGAFDPHAWQTVENAIVYVDNIAAGLSKADPDNASAYFANRAAYVAELEALGAEVDAMIAGIPEDQRTVVTSHDAFGYFSQHHGIAFLAPVGLSTESEASAADVAAIITQIREDGISAVFVETITDNRLIEQIANETGAKVGGSLYSDALSGPDGPASTYIDMMRHNAKTLSEALSD
ncbi:MAG: zinc ABC transporter substrate-binding protein [Pseudomonadota bacterium]